MLLLVFGIALIGTLSLFVVMVAMQPAAFRISRGIAMSVPPAAVFARVNDLRQWQAWSPWEKIDPAMKKNFSGPPGGVGAVYEWDGNAKAGKGRTTIIESTPNERVGMKLEMIRPVAATNAVEFTFIPEGNQTTVTWTMTGTNGFLAKAFTMFMNMDKMVGGEFESGLAQLKRVVESPSGITASAIISGVSGD